MIAFSDLPETLPIFPLSGALLLPRGHLPLHIFEPRYVAMVKDALGSEHRLIGMIQPVTEDDDAPLHRIGCAGRIMSFTETAKETYMIALSGVLRFELGEILPAAQPYQQAHVGWPGFEADLDGEEQDESLERPPFLKLLERYFDTAGLDVDLESLRDAEDETLVNALASLSPFDARDKQALLEAQTLSQRRVILATLMEFAVRGANRVERIQ